MHFFDGAVSNEYFTKEQIGPNQKGSRKRNKGWGCSRKPKLRAGQEVVFMVRLSIDYLIETTLTIRKRKKRMRSVAVQK